MAKGEVNMTEPGIRIPPESARQQPKPDLLTTLRALAAGRGSPNQVRLYTIAFTLFITAFFAALVSGLHVALKVRTRQNARAQREHLILRLMGVVKENDKIAAAELTRMFQARVMTVTLTAPDTGKPYTYWRGKDSRSRRIVFPLRGRGFWGPVHGFIGANEAQKRITSIAFTEHEETPGLGGRISEPWFTRQFIGKPLVINRKDGKFIRVVQGGAKDKSREVDAITGATGTSSAIEKMVNASIELQLRITNYGLRIQRKQHADQNIPQSVIRNP